MSFTKFCPKCGKDTDTLLKGMCKNCYLKGEDLFTIKDISIDFCNRCQKIRAGFSWTQKSNDKIITEVTSKIKPIIDLEQPKIFVEMNEEKETKYKVKIKVVGMLAGVLVQQEKEFVLDLEKGICDPCMKLSSEYREAILQLRTDKGTKEAEELLKLAEGFIVEEKAQDSLAGIVNLIRTKNGFDIWIGSSKAGARIANKIGKLYHIRVVTTKKLIGEDQGKRKFRHTYLVRT